MTRSAVQHSQPHRKPNPWGLAWVGFVVGFAALLVGAAPVYAVDHIATPQAIQALCKHAEPVTPARYKTQPVVYARGWRDDIKARHGKLLRLYSVDVQPQHFKVADYSEATNLLTLVAQERFALFDGSFGLALRDDPLLVYEVDSKRADVVKMAHSTDQAVLRLFFVLDALHDPKSAYCEERRGEVMLRGQLVASQIWRVESAGQKSLAAEVGVLLAAQRPKGAQKLEVLVGQRMDKRASPSPRVKTTNVRVMNGISMAPRRLESLSRDADLLLMPCFLSSLAEGGAHEAAMTVESWFTAEGHTRDTLVTVDASGSPTLCTCVSSQLKMLELGAASEPVGVRLNIFFDRR